MIGCLLDTGPLVTLLDRSEPAHAGVKKFLNQLQGQRLLTTGAVITEAFHLLSDVREGPERLVSFLAESATEVHDAFGPAALSTAARLMAKYADCPMDFADATLVWLAEQTGTDRVLTLDRRGFRAYRYGRSRRFHLVLDA